MEKSGETTEMKSDEQYNEMVQMFVRAIELLTKHNMNLENKLKTKQYDSARPRDDRGHFVSKGGVKFIASKEEKKKIA